MSFICQVRANTTKSTAKIKALADVRPIAIDDADSIIRSFHLGLHEQAQSNGEAAPVAATA